MVRVAALGVVMHGAVLVRDSNSEEHTEPPRHATPFQRRDSAQLDCTGQGEQIKRQNFRKISGPRRGASDHPNRALGAPRPAPQVVERRSANSPYQ